MADYPNTVKNFLDKQDGIDKVVADHINQPQNEITAIQTMLGPFGNSQSNLISLTEFNEQFRAGTRVITGSTTEFEVTKGSIVIQDDSNNIRWRRNTDNQTKDFDNLDTGSVIASTLYNVYATADFAGQTFSTVLSLDSESPLGATYSRKIGYISTNEFSDIKTVGTIDDEMVLGSGSFIGDIGDTGPLEATVMTAITGMNIDFTVNNLGSYIINFNATPEMKTSGTGGATTFDMLLNGTTIATGQSTKGGAPGTVLDPLIINVPATLLVAGTYNASMFYDTGTGTADLGFDTVTYPITFNVRNI